MPVVGAAVEAVGELLGDIAAITELGKDLDPVEKEKAAPVAVAIISSQIAAVTAAAAAAANISGGSARSGKGKERV